MKIKKELFKTFRENCESLGYLESTNGIYIKFTRDYLITVDAMGNILVFDNLEKVYIKDIKELKSILFSIKEYLDV